MCNFANSRYHITLEVRLCGIDGIYGNNTAAAVRNFQQKEGLAQTGNASGQTRILLGFVFG